MKTNSFFFESMLTMDELLKMLKHQYSRRTVYKWVLEGMPSKKIRGRLWFPKLEVTTWLERTSK